MDMRPKDPATGLPFSDQQIAKRKADNDAAYRAMVERHGGEDAYAELKAQNKKDNKILLVTFIVIASFVGGVWYVGSSIESSFSERTAQKSSGPSSVRAQTACMNAVRARSRFPDKADFSLFSIGSIETGDGWEIAGQVDLMNGLGLMVPHKFYCRTRGTTVMTVSISPE